MTLAKQAITGMIWVFIDTFMVKGISFISTIIIARILTPDDFGLLAMISIFITIGTILVDSGMSSSLIRNIDVDIKDYSTVFYTSVLFSLLLYVFFYLLSPYIAIFYKQPVLVNIIRVYCIVFILSAISSIQITILIKRMCFKKIAVINMPAVIFGGIIGILLSYEGYGVWSIICMYITNQLLLAFFLWASSDWKPKLEFSKERFKYHFNFGWKLFLSSLMSGTFTNVYGVVIGKLYTLKTTGNFERAYIFNQYPIFILTQIIGKVTFPLLSNIQNDKKRIEFVFRKLTNITFFITAPVMFILSACANPLASVLLGKQWTEMAFMFQILCFGGVFYTLQALNINILKIYGHTDYILRGEIVLNVLTFITLIVAILISLKWLLWSIVVNSFLKMLINMYYCNKVLKIKTTSQLVAILPIFLISLVTFLFIQGVLNLEFDLYLPELLKLFFLIILGTFFYLVLSYFFCIQPLLQILTLISKKQTFFSNTLGIK